MTTVDKTEVHVCSDAAKTGLFAVGGSGIPSEIFSSILRVDRNHCWKNDY